MRLVSSVVGAACFAAALADSKSLRGQRAGDPFWQDTESRPLQYSGLERYPDVGDFALSDHDPPIADLKEHLQDSLAKEKDAELRAAELAFQAMHASTSAEVERDAAASAFNDWVEASAQVKVAQQRATKAAALQQSRLMEPQGTSEKDAAWRAQIAQADALTSARAAEIADEVTRNAEAVVKAIRNQQASFPDPSAPPPWQNLPQMPLPAAPAAAAPSPCGMPVPAQSPPLSMMPAAGAVPQGLQFGIAAPPVPASVLHPIAPIPMQLAMPVPVRLPVASYAVPVAVMAAAPAEEQAVPAAAEPPNGTASEPPPRLLLRLPTLPSGTLIARPPVAAPAR